MLDLSIFKGPRWMRSGSLDVKPFVKPSQRAATLLRDSCHPRSVHVSWPLGRFREYEILSTSAHYATAAKKRFLHKLVCHDPSHPAIRILRNRISSGAQGGRVKESRLGSWLILPFHASLQPLQKIVHSISSHWQYLARTYDRFALLQFAPRISWSKGDRSLMQVLSHDPKLG